MPDQIETAVRAVLSHLWGSGPWTAHTEHERDPECAVCRGDVAAILTVAASRLTGHGLAIVPAEHANEHASSHGGEHADLAAARQRIERAHTELGEVCAQGPSRRFKMHIPADPERDTDLIISAALNDADLLAGEVERLRATVARVRALRDYLATATGATETGALLCKVARNLSDIVDGKSAVSQDETAAPAAEQTWDDLVMAAAKALWEREFSTYEECSHSVSEMPRIAAVALDAAGLAEPAPTRWAYKQACAALERHRARADQAEAAIARVDALHKPFTIPGYTIAFCESCANRHGSAVQWPCPNHLALYGETDDTCSHLIAASEEQAGGGDG